MNEGDLRPISGVNLIYKLIIKILANRIGKVSGELISPNQASFIEGRPISDNTILADEMLYGFGRKRTPKRFCLSIDLKKASDIVKWEAITGTLEALGFSALFIKMVWNAVPSAFFSVLTEGSPTLPFKNPRGIRQGEWEIPNFS